MFNRNKMQTFTQHSEPTLLPKNDAYHPKRFGHNPASKTFPLTFSKLELKRFMKRTYKRLRVLALCIASIGGSASALAQDPKGLAPKDKASATASSDTPFVGGEAKDFELASTDGVQVKLADAIEGGPVVLVVLRGNPGYQCPLCTRQVGELIQVADALEKRKTTVILIYPGPKQALTEKAAEFLQNIKLPTNFAMVTDPDYRFTKQYGLRWDAKNETAYPSTFVIDTDGKFRFVKISKGHGDRAPTKDVVDAIP
jgi:thioredoxin-dependent peroxiredoxin